jgi:putative heme-binding domain-containing protein
MLRPPPDIRTARSTHSGRTIKVGEAYESEFERYLVRLFLEKNPKAVAEFLDSSNANSLPLENRMVATLALESKQSAPRIAELLRQLERPPTEDEVLRLAQFPGEPGVAAALNALLTRPDTLETLLKVRTKFDATKLLPALNEAAKAIWPDKANRALVLRLTSAFKLSRMEALLNEDLIAGNLSVQQTLESLRAIRELGASHLDGVVTLVRSPNREVANEAVLALASSRNLLAADYLLKKFWRELTAAQQKIALSTLATTRPGARAIVEAAQNGIVEKADLENGLIDVLYAVIPDDAALASLMEQMSLLLRPALRLNGKEDAWLDSNIHLHGPFTVETWIKLDPGISNSDGILGSPGALDINFHDARLRVWAGAQLHDAIIAKRPITHETWTHVAVTRDAQGKFRIYINGELDTAESKTAPQEFDKCRVGWTATPKGTSGWLAEYRVWNRERSADEIRDNFDRSFEGEPRPAGLAKYFTSTNWPGQRSSAKVEKTADSPALLTASEAQALAKKFAAFRSMAEKGGDVARGETLFAAACMTCHNAGGKGGQIGPVLSGAGAMGTETLLRAVLTPNAAMEAGYRAFRVETKEGDVIDGLLVSQDNEALVLRRPNSEDLRIPRGTVKRADFTRTSMMPEGLLEALKPEEVSNLFAYLRTLR